MSSLKEESPVGTGISDLPVFSAPHESVKSTPASTFSHGSRRAKQEGDALLVSLSVAAATAASAVALSDVMPPSPLSFAGTPSPASQTAPDAVSVTEPVSTPPTEVASDPAAPPSANESAAKRTAELSSAPPVEFASSSEPLRVDSPEPRDRPLSQAVEHVETADEVIAAPASEPPTTAEPTGPAGPATTSTEVAPAEPTELVHSAANASVANDHANATPSRQSRRLSSRIASSAASQQSSPAGATPARRPQRMARLAKQPPVLTPQKATTKKQASTPASTPAARSSAKSSAKASAKAKKQATSVERRATRLSGPVLDSPSTRSSTLGKRGRRESQNAKLPRELCRLQDTKEFSHIDDNPVIYTVWSNGKYVPANAAGEPLHDPKDTKTAADEAAADGPLRKKTKTGAASADSEDTEDGEPATIKPPQRRVKKWLDKGLYAGQSMPANLTVGLSAFEKKELAELPELTKKYPPNKTLPMPIFSGLRTLIQGRDFKMPFDVFNPLPRGQPKPVKYGKFSKNRFVGEAHAIWRKNPHFDEFPSKCVCKPETGCDEDCQNRIMLYECDDTNCNVGAARCHNREFQRLTERTASKNPYHVGVEVFKTADRGHGIRASRSFRPGQIIMEYIGEIITEEESDRRMNELYKNNACYYLMSFDQSLIIDGTSGSIARFVNHSCSPNCRMIKWIVSGQPRIALFAGDRPIMTGEELTYDYNFDPYSSKNVQKCLCGSENCRGILGPRKREKTISKAAAEKAAAEKAKAAKGKKGRKTGSSSALGKRKLGDASEDSDHDGPAARKARTASAAHRGPGRPRKDSGASTTTTSRAKGAAPAERRVTTTKAALEALAATSARDARAVRAAKAAKAARAAKAAKTVKTVKTAKTASKAAKAVVSRKAVKGVRAVKPVKVRVRKTVKIVKASRKAKTAEEATVTKTAKSPKTAAAAGAKTAKTPHIKMVKRVGRPRKDVGDKGTKTKEGKTKEGKHAKEAAAADADLTDEETASKATPMARAVAKAARKAATAAKAVKTAQALTKMKPKTPMAKRATAMASTAASRAGKAKAAVKKTKEAAKAAKATAAAAAATATATVTEGAVEKSAANLSAEDMAAAAAAVARVMTEVTSKVTAEVTAAAGKTGKVASSGSSNLIQQTLNFPKIGTSRSKPGRVSSAAPTASTKIAKVAKATKTTGRPVGRPPGSSKKVDKLVDKLADRLADKQAPADEEEVGHSEAAAEQPPSAALVQGEDEGESAVAGDSDSAKDVIHVASSATAAATA